MLSPGASFVDNVLRVHYFILRDDTFPLRFWLMKPSCCRTLDINELVYNFWISRWRKVVENAFGILASRFWVQQCMIQQEPGMVMCAIMACVVLHNLLWTGYGRGHFPPENMGFNLDGILQGNDLPYQG